MQDLAFVALLIFLVLLVVVGRLALAWTRRSRQRALHRAVWYVIEQGIDGVTHVGLERSALIDGEETVLEKRHVGEVDDNDPAYDEKLLDLRARAYARLAVVSGGQ